MDARSAGAAAMLSAVNGACQAFQRYGESLAARHRDLRWDLVGRVGPGDAPYVLVGVVLWFDDHTVDLGVDLWLRGELFEVSGYATVDGERLLVDLPDLLTEDLDQALTALRTYTTNLCAGRSLLTRIGAG